MSTPSWLPSQREYEREASSLSLQREDASATHPLLLHRPKASLKSSSIGITFVNSTGPEDLDPLSTFSGGSTPLNTTNFNQIGDDPLSGFLMDGSSSAGHTNLSTSDDPLSPQTTTSHMETKEENLANMRQTAQELHEMKLNTPWTQRRDQIRKEYSIVGSISLTSDAVNDFQGSGVEDGSSTHRVDKYSQRLANLEAKNGQGNRVELSQKEYEAHIEKLRTNLKRAWSCEERVVTLKIAIQLGKMLRDSSFPQFYPSMFVTVTEVLDYFGKLVYVRLVSKAEDAINIGIPAKKRKRLPENFTSMDIPDIAKETCRNWFYKASCVRELVPRIYVEIAMLRCYRLLTDTDYPMIVSRIGSIIRGIGDPMVAFYARLYLVVTCQEVAPSITHVAMTMLQDSLFTYSMLHEKSFTTTLNHSNLTLKQYGYLLSPAIHWILQCVGKNANKETFQQILQIFRDSANDSLILKHIIDSFDASHYAHAAMGMTTLIKNTNISYFSMVDLFTSLGKQLSIHPPPEDHRIPLLNDVWKIVNKSTDLLSYVQCTASWLDMVQKYYSDREMLILLGSLSQRITNSNTETISDVVMMEIENLITSLIGQSSTFGTAVLTSEHLLKILDVFKGNKKVQLCKDILESFRNQKTTTRDPVLINTLFDLARVVHDSIDGLSPVSDIGFNSELLSFFVDQVDFGRDFEQQLSFFVDCRAAFPNLERIKDKLILAVHSLSVKTYRFVKGKHNKKTANFVKACLAYCHITIPSLIDPFRRLELLLHCAQAALLNQCLPQTDSFLKAAISQIAELPVSYEVEGRTVTNNARLAAYLDHLLGFLVLVPGHPERGPFYIIHGLMKVIEQYAGWRSDATEGTSIAGTVGMYGWYKTRVYVNIISLLCTLVQKQFPYHVYGVQSNDELYGGAPGYLAELEELLNTVMTTLLKELTTCADTVDSQSGRPCQTRLALDLVNVLFANMQLKPSLVEFTYKLLDLAVKHRVRFTSEDHRYLKNTVHFAVSRLDHAEPAVAAVIPKFKTFIGE